MITQPELERFYALRQYVFDNIKQALEEDSHCKSYEGSMQLSFPNYFEKDDENSFMRCGVFLNCYVFGPMRHYEWYGRTFTEALDKAEQDINSWKHY